MTASIGPGVTYVIVRADHIADRAGARVDLRVHRRQPAPDLDAAGGAGRHRRSARRASAPRPESITFSLSREPGGNAVLQINVPEPNFLDALGLAERHRTDRDDQDDAGRRARAAGGRTGRALSSAPSSPYVEGSRVTLLEVDLDEVLKDETLLPRLQAAATPDEAKAIIKGAAGPQDQPRSRDHHRVHAKGIISTAVSAGAPSPAGRDRQARHARLTDRTAAVRRRPGSCRFGPRRRARRSTGACGRRSRRRRDSGPAPAAASAARARGRG